MNVSAFVTFQEAVRIGTMQLSHLAVFNSCIDARMLLKLRCREGP